MWEILLKQIQNFLKRPESERKPLLSSKVPLLKPENTMPEKIYQFAKSCLNTDIAATQNELGCAESISYIFIQTKVPHFPKEGYLSTADFYTWLETYAERVTDPLPGDVIIAPTGKSTKGAAHGHIGIIAKYGILSCNSMNGLFQEYFTIVKWLIYYGGKLGFPTLFYRIKGV